MFKKLFLFIFIFIGSGMRAMEDLPPKKRRLHSPSVNPVLFASNAYLDRQDDPVIVRPKACKFPCDYATREFIANDEWELLPPTEQEKWIFDQYMPEEVTTINDVPETTKRGIRIRKEIFIEKIRLYRERMGYIDFTTLKNGGTHE